MFLLIVKFAYNNSKNASTRYPFFKINYRYHLRISYKKDSRSRFKIANKLSKKLRNLITVYRQNL